MYCLIKGNNTDPASLNIVGVGLVVYSYLGIVSSYFLIPFFFSEYDSEMDDFIDDSDAKIDISAEIRNIFGYDKRKFRDEVN